MSNGARASKDGSGLAALAPSLGLISGLVLIASLVLWSGLGQVMSILMTAGAGLLLIVFLAPPEILSASEAWRQLFPKQRRPGFRSSLRASWMGMAVNTLLPVATVGGEVVKARVVVLAGTPLADAVAATLVDKTVQAIAILLWGIVGLMALASLSPGDGLLWGGLAGAALLALGIGGFIALQWHGSFSHLARLGGGLFSQLGTEGSLDAGRNMDRAVRAIYRRPAALLRSLGLRLLGQVWLVSEILLTATLLGLAIGLDEALMLRALIGAVRGFSFIVPAGLGLQEGAYVALGALIGLPADMMLALSLASRLREILPSLPGLVLWQHLEGRRLWRSHAAARRPAAEGKSGPT